MAIEEIEEGGVKRGADSDATAAQVRALVSTDAEGIDIARVLGNHRVAVPRPQVGGPRPAVRLIDGADGNRALISAGDVLVRPDQTAAATPTLAEFGFALVPGHTVASLFSSPAIDDTESLVAVVRKLRSQGIVAGPNLVHAFKQIKMKGNGSPARAVGHPGVKATADRNGLGVVVAVIDTGVSTDAATRSDHWLKSVIVDVTSVDPLDAFGAGGVDGPDGNLDPAAGHGTFGAGVIRYLAPAATILPLRALDSDGVGTDLSVAEAVVQAGKLGANIINLSLGTPAFEGQPPVAMAEAIARLDPGIVVVAAAGNSGENLPHYPAAFKRVVAVAALTQKLTPAVWSNYGDWVDCATVGEGVVGTFPHWTGVWSAANAWAVWTGTSFAAPQITGAIARRMSEKTTARQALAGLLQNRPYVAGYGRTLSVIHPGTLAIDV